MSSTLLGADVFCAEAMISGPACMWKGMRSHSRSGGRVQCKQAQRGSSMTRSQRLPHCCQPAEDLKEPDDLALFSSSYVSSLMHESVQDYSCEFSDRIEFIDEDEQTGETTAEPVAKLESPSSKSHLETSFNFDDDVMSVSSEDGIDDDFYSRAAQGYVEEAIRDAKIDDYVEPIAWDYEDAASQSSEEWEMHMEEEDHEHAQYDDFVEDECQEAVIEAYDPSEDFVVDYVFGLLDKGIIGLASSDQQHRLPSATELSPSFRPSLEACRFCPSETPALQAEALSVDCLPTALPQAPCAPQARLPAATEAREVTPATPSTSKRSVTKNRRRIIGGVVRAPVEHLEASTAESSLTSTTQGALNRSSSLARSYDALGAAQFFQLDVQDGPARAGSRAGSPAWSSRPARKEAISAMALDLGDFSMSSHIASRSTLQPSTAGPGTALRVLKSGGTEGGIVMSKSSSTGSLGRGAKAGGLVLPALPGASSRPGSLAAFSVAGWAVQQPRLACLHRTQSFSYGF